MDDARVIAVDALDEEAPVVNRVAKLHDAQPHHGHGLGDDDQPDGHAAILKAGGQTDDPLQPAHKYDREDNARDDQQALNRRDGAPLESLLNHVTVPPLHRQATRKARSFPA